MFLAEVHEAMVEYSSTSVTLTVAVSAFVVVALGWMSRAARSQPTWPEPELDDD